jgi:hypothetical protein
MINIYYCNFNRDHIYQYDNRKFFFQIDKNISMYEYVYMSELGEHLYLSLSLYI